MFEYLRHVLIHNTMIPKFHKSMCTEIFVYFQCGLVTLLMIPIDKK